MSEPTATMIDEIAPMMAGFSEWWGFGAGRTSLLEIFSERFFFGIEFKNDAVTSEALEKEGVSE